MMADDITLNNKDLQSIANSVNIFSDFEQCSGLKLNLNKTEIILIGNETIRKITLPPHLKNIKVKHGSFKALGVWFSTNSHKALKLNIHNK